VENRHTVFLCERGRMLEHLLVALDDLGVLASLHLPLVAAYPFIGPVPDVLCSTLGYPVLVAVVAAHDFAGVGGEFRPQVIQLAGIPAHH